MHNLLIALMAGYGCELNKANTALAKPKKVRADIHEFRQEIRALK